MAARYTRLPTTDPLEEVKIDFGSGYRYSTANELGGKGNYGSAFKFSDWTNKHKAEDIRFQKVKQPLFNRICHYVVTVLCVLIVVVTFPISAWFCFKVVTDHEKVVIFRLGRFVATKGTGVIFIIPCIDKFKRVDIRVKAFNVPPQQIITSDRGVVEVGADVQYKVVSVEKVVMCVRDINHSIRVLVEASLKNQLVRKTVDEMQRDKVFIAAIAQDDSNKSAKDWGVQVTKVEIPIIKVIQSPEPPNPMAGLPSGMPQAFQQMMAAIMMNATGAANQGDAASPGVEESKSSPTEEGAVGVDDSLPAPRDVMKLANSLVNDSMIRSIGAVYAFQLSGHGGGMFYLDAKNGTGGAGEGLPPGGDPDVTLTLSVEDMQDMFLGNTKPLQAYMSGRLKVSGDLSAALRLEEFVKKVVEKLKGDTKDV